MSLARFHRAFATAISGGDASALAGMLPRAELCGFNVYRNNSSRALIDALASNYPAVRRIVGDDWFSSSASIYITAAPAYVRTLVGYGESFPDFLAQAPPESQTPAYLADIARLDRAWLEAHLASDERTLEAEDLADFDGQMLASLRLQLHASVRLASLTWEMHEIWAANHEPSTEAEAPRLAAQGMQTVLIWRPDAEVRHRQLSPGEAAFLSSVADGESLGEAAQAADAAREPAPAIFAGSLAAGVFAARVKGREVS